MTQKKPHIAIISECSSGGTKKHVLDLINGIDKSKFRITYIYSLKRADNSFKEELDNLSGQDIEFVNIPMVREINPIKDLKCLFQLIFSLKKLNPDLIHLHASKAGVLGRIAALFLKNRLVLFNPHGGSFHRFKGRFGFFYKAIEKLLLFKFVHMIGVSEYSCSLFKNELGLEDRRNHLIYNGIEVKELVYVAGNNSENARLNLLWPAFFYDEKGHIEFIKVLKGKKLDNNIRISLAGTGPLLEQVKGTISSEGLSDHFKFLGYQSNIEKLINECDAVLLPSKKEFLPYAILESMEKGKPVFTTCTGAIPEMVEDFVNGRIFKTSEIDKLIESLNKYANKKAELESMGKAGRKIIEEKFSISDMIDKTENLYLTLSNSNN